MNGWLVSPDLIAKKNIHKVEIIYDYYRPLSIHQKSIVVSDWWREYCVAHSNQVLLARFLVSMAQTAIKQVTLLRRHRQSEILVVFFLVDGFGWILNLNRRYAALHEVLDAHLALRLLLALYGHGDIVCLPNSGSLILLHVIIILISWWHKKMCCTLLVPSLLKKINWLGRFYNWNLSTLRQKICAQISWEQTIRLLKICLLPVEKVIVVKNLSSGIARLVQVEEIIINSVFGHIGIVLDCNLLSEGRFTYLFHLHYGICGILASLIFKFWVFRRYGCTCLDSSIIPRIWKWHFRELYSRIIREIILLISICWA